MKEEFESEQILSFSDDGSCLFVFAAFKIFVQQKVHGATTTRKEENSYAAFVQNDTVQKFSIDKLTILPMKMNLQFM